MLRSIRAEIPAEAAGFPLGLPFLKTLGEMRVSPTVTLFAGPNGSGKSTLLEALARECRFPAIGGAAPTRDSTLDPVEPLARAIRLTWSTRTRHGFFLRSEDVFNFILGLQRQQQELARELADADARLEGSSEYARRLGLGPLRGSMQALSSRYGLEPDARSHGETFLHLFRERLTPRGLYLMDEPEAALAPESQLALVALMSDAVAAGSQFVVATHSPLLLAIPGAALYDFDGGEIRKSRWDELASIQLWKGVLEAPERFMRHVWQPGGEAVDEA